MIPKRYYYVAAMIVSFLFSNIAFAGLFENKFEKEVKLEKIAVKLVKEVKEGGYDVISVSELKDCIDAGKKMVIIDAMPLQHYKKKHIPGAVQFHFPVEPMDKWDTSKTEGRSMDDYISVLGDDKSVPVVVYCGFVKCARSHNAACWAKRLGYKNVYRLPGGIYAWQGADYPIEP